MASEQPFEPDVKSGSAGFTQVIVVGSAGTGKNIQFNEPTATAVLITGVNTNAVGSTTGVVYMRMSVESSTGIASANSSTDTPLVLIPQVPTVRLFASPNPGGVFNLSVICSVSSTVAGAWKVWATPGQGGIL